MTVTTPAPRPVTPSTILAATLQHLLEQLDSGATPDPGWRAALRQAADLAAGLDPYLDRWTTPESPALTALAERTRRHDWNSHGGEVFLEQEMISGHVEGQLLKMLVHATRAVRVLEIGMFTGYSALAMAEALSDGGTVVACEVDPGVAELAQECFAAAAAGYRISVRVGDARATLADLAAASEVFDLVFIDADKASYRAYVTALLDGGMLAPHGVICVDNTLMQGQPWAGGATPNGDAIAAFNEFVANEPRVEQVIVPIRDGVTLIRQVAAR